MSTVLASRNNNNLLHHQSFMGEIPNFPNNNNNNNNLRHLHPNPNPNKNPNQKHKSAKRKHFSNGRLNNNNDLHGGGLSQTASDDGYSFNQSNNQRVVDDLGGNYGSYVTYNVAACSRGELVELRRKLVSDLERIRRLNDRIQVGELNANLNAGLNAGARTSNGKFKNLSGNKRMGNAGPVGISKKEAKHLQKVNDGLMKLCKQVLTKLMKHKMSWIFKKPVDAVAFGLHDYHQIIKRPMDLGTVKVNLTKNGYANPMEFASDVRLVFENAMLYNPRTDDVHKMADQLLTFFEELFRPIKANLPDVNHGNEFSGINELLRSSKMAGAHNHGNKFLGINEVERSSKMVAHNHVSEFSGINELDRSSKMAAHNQVKEFSAVDELDGSSWDDVQTPERSKKRKTSSSSGPVVPFVPPVTNKQKSHSAVSKPIMQPVVQSVPSPVRRTPSPMQVVEPPSPMQVAEPPSPMQVAEQAEPVKPSSTATRTVVPKLPKPRAKDVNKRDMNMEEKQKLGLGLQSMPPEKMPQLLQIIRKRNDQLAQEGDEIELDIEALDTETLWELDRFVTNWKKHVSKTKRQALMVNNGQGVAAPSASADIDIDDVVPLSDNKMDGTKKSKKEAGEEDVDIGEEMPESSFPHVEIEKDDGVVAGEGVSGHGNGTGNASSSSSGSSSSSSGDSSSSSDSGSGSSSGSDSDADDAQS